MPKSFRVNAPNNSFLLAVINLKFNSGQEITPLNSECSSSSVTVTVDSSPPTMLDTPEDSNDAPISAEGGSQSGSIPLPENVKGSANLFLCY